MVRIVAANFVNNANVWMLDARSQLSFCVKEICNLVVTHKLGMNSLDDDELLKAPSTATSRQKEITNIPAREFREQGKAPETWGVRRRGQGTQQRSAQSIAELPHQVRRTLARSALQKRAHLHLLRIKAAT